MKRRILLLDAALIGLIAFAGWQARQTWLAAQEREAAKLGVRVKPVSPPPFTPLPPTPPVAATGYAPIAQQTLFDKSRNPNVVIEQPPPPPPKPMPPLPVYHGQLNVGAGPTAILSVTGNSAHEAIHPGEQIGQFKLLDVNSDEITFEWEGQTVRKRVDALVDRTAQAPAAADPGAGTRTEQPVVAAAPVPKTPTGPGADTGRGFKTCDPNDSTPEGAVVDGFRKVVTPTPFGSACRWDPVGH